MKTWVLNARGECRNGVWIAVFLALFLASRQLYTPVLGWLRGLGIDELWLQPAKFGLVLLITLICLRLRRQRLAAVGFDVGARWWRQAGSGLALGAASVLLAVLPIWWLGGVEFQPHPAAGFEAILIGLYVFLCVALFEETLFRGFVFQRLVDGSRPWVAQLVLASLFASAHWGNPEMHGITLWLASMELFLAAWLLGLAYLRTASLALPIGLHLGWNWMLGSVLGFPVSGFSQPSAWQAQVSSGPDWLHGGAFGLEASIFAVLVDLLLIGLLWRWKPQTAKAAP